MFVAVVEADYVLKEEIEMCTVAIRIPDEVMLHVHKTQAEIALYMKRLYAVDLYRKKEVSLGYCAALAEMTKEEFIKLLAEYNISIFSYESEDELLGEFKNA